MTDFHTHILPGIDDGSRDIEMTALMLEEEAGQGVTHIYATPHFYAHRRSVQSFLERREKAFDKVKALLKEHPGFPEITAGAEVYYFSGMGKAEQLPELCVEGTDILLLEMPFGQWDDAMRRDIEEIIHRRELRVVLAHAERYEAMQKDRDAWDRILGMDLTIQMNAGSFITGFGSGMHARRSARFCMQMLQQRHSCIIGTDCHNLSDRAPNLAAGRAAIEKKLGAERLSELDEYTEELLGDNSVGYGKHFKK